MLKKSNYTDVSSLEIIDFPWWITSLPKQVKRKEKLLVFMCIYIVLPLYLRDLSKVEHLYFTSEIVQI